MIKRLSAVVLLSALMGLCIARAQTPVLIEIDRSSERYNLGLAEFVPDGKKTPPDAVTRIHKTLLQDLEFSRLFNIVKEGPVVQGPREVEAWAKFGVQVVVGGQVRLKANQKMVAEATIYDTGTRKAIFRTERSASLDQERTLSHQISNDIFEYFTGVKGIYTSKIAFVSDVSGRKELYIAEYDGRNAKRLTQDNSIVILPRLSPDGTKVIFTSYRSGNPDLYIMNVDGSGRKKLSEKAGLNVSPSWAPNGQELAVTLSLHGPPNIYLIDMTGNIIQRLTNSNGADTAPSFSPDGTQISFTSDRDGAPHIYLMGIDGTGLRRLTTDGHSDSSAWSPDGKTIVYVKGKGGYKFDIYSLEVLTGIERRLTWSEGDNENPTWSPDGRTVLFISTRRGRPELFHMALDGTEQKPLEEQPGSCYTPHWSN